MFPKDRAAMVKRYDHVVEELRSIIREQDKEVERMKKK
jgi:hypothetical protein